MFPASSVARQHSSCVARRRVPLHAPALPRGLAERRRLQLGRGPRRAAVGAELRRCGSRRVRTRRVRRSGTARRRPSARACRSRGCPAGPSATAARSASPARRVVVVDPHVVGRRLVVAGERRAGHLDRRQPLHVRHAVPAGDHKPQRESVLGRQRGAVQRRRRAARPTPAPPRRSGSAGTPARCRRRCRGRRR